MYWGFRDEKHCTEYSVNKWEEIPRDILIGICAGVVQVIFSVVTILLAYYTEWHDPNNEEAYIKPKHKEKVSSRAQCPRALRRAQQPFELSVCGVPMRGWRCCSSTHPSRFDPVDLTRSASARLPPAARVAVCRVEA
jgi:hypothetical protein